MAVLIYVGSTHLHDAAMHNPNESSRVAQSMWRAVYLFVSFLCFTGGLLVIAPAENATAFSSFSCVSAPISASFAARAVALSVAFSDADSNLGSLTPTTSGTTAAASSSCCGCGSFCGLLFLKTMNAMKAAKAQFWDASGDFFWVKLVVMEVLEISLQIYSLSTSATSSHVDAVALSAWIIAANFIVLPLSIMLVPLVCSSSSQASSHHSVMATVMVIEVLFDKLYVAVGVLLRSGTMTDPTLNFMGQLTVHGALLLPALMTALDVQDALDH